MALNGVISNRAVGLSLRLNTIRVFLPVDSLKSLSMPLRPINETRRSDGSFTSETAYRLNQRKVD
jgi:hypothetical protein